MPPPPVPLPPRDDPRIRWSEDTLRFRDTDANGHVNNTSFSEFCENGRVQFFRAHMAPPGVDGPFFVIGRFAIDYRAELHYPGTVRTGTWLCALGRSSVTFRQVVIAPDGGLAAEARSVCVQMDRATRRPLPFADGMREAALALLLPDLAAD